MIILPPTVEPRTRRELSAFVIDSIEAAGVRVPPTSRLRQMHELYVNANGVIEPDHPDFQTALEAERDMQLLGFAFDRFASTEPSNTYRQLIKKLVGDSVLPQLDRARSAGRDAAFELYVGADCRSAELNPVEWEEPDVTCVWNGTKYGFAAKRLKSVKNLERRVRDAVDQIAGTGLPGIIALDTCLAFNPNNDRIAEPIADPVFASRYFEVLAALWSKHQPKVQEIMSRANVLGVVVHDHQVRLQPDRQWSLSGMSMRVTATARSMNEQREFEALAALYAFSLPNQQEVS